MRWLESLNAIRVTNALNIQPVMAKRYNSHLGAAEKEAATRTWKAAFSKCSLYGDDVFDVLSWFVVREQTRGGFDGQCTKEISTTGWFNGRFSISWSDA